MGTCAPLCLPPRASVSRFYHPQDSRPITVGNPELVRHWRCRMWFTETCQVPTAPQTALVTVDNPHKHVHKHVLTWEWQAGWSGNRSVPGSLCLA